MCHLKIFLQIHLVKSKSFFYIMCIPLFYVFLYKYMLIDRLSAPDFANGAHTNFHLIRGAEGGFKNEVSLCRSKLSS